MAVGLPMGWLLTIGTLRAWGAYEGWGRKHLAAIVTVPAFLKRDSLLEDYVVGALFIAHIIGFRAISTTFETTAKRIGKPLRWAAGATFTIYLLHLPVAQFLTTQLPWPPTSWQTRTVMFAGTLLMLFALAEVTDRRKEPWKRGFKTLLAQAQPSHPVA